MPVQQKKRISTEPTAGTLVFIIQALVIIILIVIW
jgi:hypothetical protein